MLLQSYAYCPKLVGIFDAMNSGICRMDAGLILVGTTYVENVAL